jgi:hypothetical protein
MTVNKQGSDFNLQSLTTDQFENHLKGTIDIGETLAIFGLRGSGKTMISKQQIAAAGLQELYINLSVFERVDLAGYPKVFSSQEKTYVDFLLPYFFKSLLEGDKKVVAILDEVDKADQSLCAPLLEFTQFRSINGLKFPNLHAIIMTGNLISEGGSRPSLPLLDRAEKYLLKADASSWLKWAARPGSKIHPTVYTFIHDNEKQLLPESHMEEKYADKSPRGWERVSDICRHGERLGWSYDFINEKVKGCVGKEAGIAFAHYLEFYQELMPLVQEIFSGNNVIDNFNLLPKSKKMMTSIIVCSRLSNELDSHKQILPDNFPAILNHVGKFFSKIEQEDSYIAIRSMIGGSRIISWSLLEHPQWHSFIKDINKDLANNGI